MSRERVRETRILPPGIKPLRYSSHQSPDRFFKLPPSAVGSDLPERSLHDVAVYDKNFRKLVSLLNVAEEGPVHVVGKVYAEDILDDPYLRPSNKASEYLLVFSDIKEYSVGLQPVFAQIWITSPHGYFRLATPSAEFGSIFSKMHHATEILYMFMDLQDARVEARVKKPLKDSDIWFELARQDATGVTEEEIEDHVNLADHATFLKSHLGQSSEMQGEVYEWFTEVFMAPNQKYQRPERSPSPKREKSPPSPLPTHPFYPPILPPARNLALERRNRISKQENRSSSAEANQNILPVDFMLKVTEDEDMQRCSIESIWSVVYRQCGVWRPPLARAVVMLHSSALLKALPEKWKGSRLEGDLKKHAKYSCTESEAQKFIQDARTRPPLRLKQRYPGKDKIKLITQQEWFGEAAEMTVLRLRSKTGNKNAKKSSQPQNVYDNDVSMADAEDATDDAQMADYPIMPSIETEVFEPVRNEQRIREEYRQYLESITSRSADDQEKLDRERGVRIKRSPHNPYEENRYRKRSRNRVGDGREEEGSPVPYNSSIYFTG